MSQVKWLVENFVDDNGYAELIAEIKKQGMECHVLDIRNHFEVSWELKTMVEGPLLFQGSIQMFRKLKQELAVGPLGWMTDENYLCTNYYPKFQKYLFNDWHMFTTVAGMRANMWNIYNTFGKGAKEGKEGLIHIRPNGGDKTFSGQLIDIQDFQRCFSNTVKFNIKDEDIAVVSTPKNIIGEWRFICSNKPEIVAVSSYMYRGKRTYVPSAPEGATNLCKEILKVGWYPDPMFTVDICEDGDNNYWLMEFNSFTSAGTYGADKEKIVKAVSEIAVQLYTKP